MLVAICVLLFAGCGPDERSGDNGSDRPRIAVIMKSLANEFFVNMEAGTREHHAAHADEYDLIINGIKDEAALAEQVALVEQMIAIGIDVIVLAPADSRAMIPVVKRALDRGIVVINIDNRLDADILARDGIKVPFVGPVDRDGAYKVGEYLGRHLEPADQVAIIGGISTAYNAQQRQLGFEEAMDEISANIVSVQDGNWHQDKASTIASALIAEHPDLRALLCSNDNMAIGAAAAVRQAGKTGEILVVGYDNISATHPLLQSGEMLATAEQYGNQLAVHGIEFALQILNGGAVPEDRMTPVDLVTADDI